ncbi:MAG: N-acetyltransferase [Ilumatobacteraceae bacterium]|nr:N-acetyltransferase [Ilumatobacteraceae bacterium]
MHDAEAEIVDDGQRWSLRVGGHVVSWADYWVEGDVVVIPHVETDLAHRGHGFAARLLDGVAELVRAQGRTIRPVCSYAAAHLRTRPDAAELLAR